MNNTEVAQKRAFTEEDIVHELKTKYATIEHTVEEVVLLTIELLKKYVKRQEWENYDKAQPDENTPASDYVSNHLAVNKTYQELEIASNLLREQNEMKWWTPEQYNMLLDMSGTINMVVRGTGGVGESHLTDTIGAAKLKLLDSDWFKNL